MSTKYYLTKRSPGKVLPGPPKGDWARDLAGYRTYSLRDRCFELSTTKTDGGKLEEVDLSEASTVTDEDQLFMTWVTPQLDAQLITGTLDVVIGVRKDNDDTTVGYKIHAYISVGNTRTVRHTLLDKYIDANNWSTTAGFRSLASPQSLTPGTTVGGDRVVVEIGFHISSNPVTNTAFSLWHGTSNNSAAPYDDGSTGSTNVTFEAPYLTFTHTFSEQALPSSPAHSQDTEAIEITSVPYSDTTGYDTTVSDGTNKAVWYTWTADRTGKMITHALGSNYYLDIQISATTPGGTNIANRFGDFLWIGQTALIFNFDAVEGVTYYFKIINVATAGIVGGAPRSGGNLVQFVLNPRDTSTLPGDVFLDCQHIVAVRDGRFINFTSIFYGLTPTGNAIDLSGFPIDNFAGVDPHTDPRLAIVLFDFRLIEFIDLHELNPGPNETNFIAYGSGALGDLAPIHSHPSHIVFDRDWSMYVGHFGDAYSSFGVPGTPASSKIRKIKYDVDDYEVLDSWEVIQENSGSDYFDLDSANENIYYTSAGRNIYKLRLSDGDISIWATIPQDDETQPRPGLRGLRLLPPGDGSGGLIVCDGASIKRINSTGSIAHTYYPSVPDHAHDLDKIELGPDASYFYVSDQLHTTLWKFTVAGNELDHWDLWLPSGQLCGFSVYQGYRAGSSIPLPGETVATIEDVRWRIHRLDFKTRLEGSD